MESHEDNLHLIEDINLVEYKNDNDNTTLKDPNTYSQRKYDTSYFFDDDKIRDDIELLNLPSMSVILQRYFSSLILYLILNFIFSIIMSLFF